MDHSIKYQFLPELFLRTPFYSFNDYSLKKLPEVLKNEKFRNAIYLASPDFYNHLEKKEFDFNKLDEKEKFSISKYYNRTSFRPTPFGSFSAITNLEWNNDATVKLVGEDLALLNLLPDQKICVAFLNSLQKRSDEYRLTINPTLYRLGNEFRFIRSVEDEKGRYVYMLNSISTEKLNVRIINLLKKGPTTFKRVLSWIITHTECSDNDAEEYLKFLIAEQVLYTEFAGNIIEANVKNGHFNPKGDQIEAIPPLQNFWNDWKVKPLKEVHKIKPVSEFVKSLMPEICEEAKSQYFYSNVERPLRNGGLNSDCQQQLSDVIIALQKLAIPTKSANLEKFITDFQIRFDKEKVPLLLAIDPDAGIAYGNLQSDDQNIGILENIYFTQKKQEDKKLNWTSVHQLILKLWVMNPDRRLHNPIVIKPSDLKSFSEPENKSFPSTLSVLFRKVEEKLFVESIGGATATSLIGRFSVFNKDCVDLCRKLVVEESTAHPEVLFADIGQLSDSHVDNINRRLPIYDYEIPLNVYSVLPLKNQIRPDDILVYVENGELILESIKMKKRIIPRLSTAYNYNNNDLAIFRLLCDVQHQGLKSVLSLDLERLFPGMFFYPRVEFGNTIISPAIWLITGDDLEMLKNCPGSQIAQTLHSLREKHNIPSNITIGTADQQLIFDLDQEEDRSFFMQCVEESKRNSKKNPRKSFSKLTIKEFIASDQSVITNNKPLIGQFVAFLSHKDNVYDKLMTNKLNVNVNETRNFILGSKWLYFKIYCTPKTSDSLLISVVAPILQKNRKSIACWFFIRYMDEKGYHLRLRIQVNEIDLGFVLRALQQQIDKQHQLIKDYEGGVYNRELERYGADIINEVEDFFCLGSDLAMAFIKIIKSGRLAISAFQVAVWNVYLIVSKALPDSNTQIAFLKHNSEAFLKEIVADKLLKVDLDKKYRELFTDINRVLENECLMEQLEKVSQQNLNKLLCKWDSLAERITGKNRLVALLSDLIHMQINRLFASEQRKYELLTYYCLYKYTVSKVARESRPLN